MSSHDAYRVEPWALRESRLDLGSLAQSESLLALANGHLGLRGNLDEGEPSSLNGTYLNGLYESHPFSYAEPAFGLPEAGQTIVNVTDGKLIRLLVEDEPMDMHRGTLLSHERVMDFRTGLLERRLTWQSIGRHTVRVTSRRLVSFRFRSVAAISYEVEAPEEPLRLALQSNLLANESDVVSTADPRRTTALRDVLQGRLHVARGTRAVLAHTTRNSGLSLAAGMEHMVDAEDDPAMLIECEPDLARLTITVQAAPGRPVRLVKFLAYHWSSSQSVEWLRDQVDGSLESAMAEGFEGLVQAQRGYLDDFWSRADIEIDGDDELQQALRYSLYQTLQATARAEQRAIAAKGLTGSGYDGHAFWDTESFVLPLLTYIAPRLTRDALIWRHATLDLARERAHQLGLRGAAFPWRTIHGEECSGYWPAGMAAVHINADIAGAVRRYVSATGDDAFERDYGTALLVETARLWLGLGHVGPDDRFRIDGVTGPDEYSAVVDNNIYTNLMAQANLRAAAEAVERHPDVGRELQVDDDEILDWRTAAETMFIPYDEVLGLHPQDQDFLDH
ncbi:MAG TPA: family 65 glycosyl hydrolase, partial [Thermoleophilia bacterium]|nr:family 65 glycosyl hydrolase [Thermoleophilia bacterium]